MASDSYQKVGVNNVFLDLFKKIEKIEFKHDNRVINIVTPKYSFSFFINGGKWNYGGIGIIGSYKKKKSIS